MCSFFPPLVYETLHIYNNVVNYFTDSENEILYIYTLICGIINYNIFRFIQNIIIFFFHTR